MKRKVTTTLIAFSLFFSSSVWATPTGLFWTTCTTDTLDTGKGNIDVDNYFTLFEGKGKSSSFSPDLGFTLGVLSFGDFKLETGIDYLVGHDNAFYFNSKVGIDEGKLFKDAPSMCLGIFDVGTKSHKTNYNVVDFVIGKSLPEPIGGRLFLGAFYGAHALGKNRQGVMVGISKGFYQVKYLDGRDYYKWVFLADFASGKNVLGGGGFGLSYYFTPDISLEGGPVWFSDTKVNGPWKWSLQLDIGIPCFSP